VIPTDQAHPVQDSRCTPTIPQPSRSGTLIIFQDLVPYPHAWVFQQRLHAERVSGTRADTLVLLEHLPVYTVGRRTKSVHLRRGEVALRATGAAIEPVNRGGSVTYHGPGQLVGYPILTLTQYASGPKAYVRLLEDVLIATLAVTGITGHRMAHKPGVWTRSDRGMAKVASIGVRVEHGVTLHGFALNVDLNLSPFALIVPCGLEECETTSMAEIMQAPVSLPLIARQVATAFSSVFHLVWESPSADIQNSHRWQHHSVKEEG
jgi:lipoyl(octanoyl) transferase